jgi:hypothetical protein
LRFATMRTGSVMPGGICQQQYDRSRTEGCRSQPAKQGDDPGNGTLNK